MADLTVASNQSRVKAAPIKHSGYDRMADHVNRVPAGVPAATQERRVWIRHLCEREGACESIMASNHQPWPAKVGNLSRGGILLLVNRRFEAKTLLQIELAAQGEDAELRVFARVVHVTPHAIPGWWSMGCAFARNLSTDEVEILTNSARAAASIPPAPSYS